MNAHDLARYTIWGPVTVNCSRCEERHTFGANGEDVPLSDLAAWGRDHRCRVPGPPRRGRALQAVPA